MTFEEHFKSLIENLNNRFPQLVKKYNLCVVHSGGGCFHVDYVLNNKLSVSINPFDEDVEYDVPKDKKTKCIFGIYSEDGEQTKTFIKPFEEGLKKLEKMKGERLKCI